MFNAPQGVDKLKRVLINDKHFDPLMLNDVIKNDIYKVLLNYMNIGRDDVVSAITVDEDGYYVLRCKVKCKHMKVLGIRPK